MGRERKSDVRCQSIDSDKRFVFFMLSMVEFHEIYPEGHEAFGEREGNLPNLDNPLSGV
jgi:hypothetical protein